MVRLPFISTPTARPLIALGAIALTLAIQPARACEQSAQDIEEPIAIVGDGGTLPFMLAPISSEIDEPIDVAAAAPSENTNPIEPTLVAGNFEFD